MSFIKQKHYKKEANTTLTCRLQIQNTVYWRREQSKPFAKKGFTK